MTTPTPVAPIRVVVAHQNPYVAAGIAAFLRSNANLVVQTGDAAEPADVVVTDYEAGMNLAGVAMRRPNGRQPASLVVTDQSAGWHVRRAVDAGVRGYLLQDCSPDDLIEALHTVAAGRRYLSAVVAGQLLDALTYDAPSARQFQVLQLISLGMSNKEISRRLGIGERTVKTHVKAVLVKLGGRTRTAAMAEAIRRGMVGVVQRPCVSAASA